MNLLVIHIIVKNQMDKDVLQHVEKEDIKAYMILCDVSAARQKSGGGSVNFILRIK